MNPHPFKFDSLLRGGPPAGVKTYEYRRAVIAPPGNPDTEAVLDGLGGEGWEMVGPPLPMALASSPLAAAAGQAQPALVFFFRRERVRPWTAEDEPQSCCTAP